ncbi:hypothetical protein MJT46_018202 [Ovis ammon polii x Ovis aries]|nr:hypothetical protein MJT46_018202 [Ovis ammon polii x Ovis aries]
MRCVWLPGLLALPLFWESGHKDQYCLPQDGALQMKVCHLHLGPWLYWLMFSNTNARQIQARRMGRSVTLMTGFSGSSDYPVAREYRDPLFKVSTSGNEKLTRSFGTIDERNGIESFRVDFEPLPSLSEFTGVFTIAFTQVFEHKGKQAIDNTVTVASQGTAKCESNTTSGP